MKKYHVHHQTQYQFSAAVQISPHTLRLRPRENHEQHIEAFSLKVEPSTSIRWHRDVEGNSIAVTSFFDDTQLLTIESQCDIIKYDLAPQDFVIADYANHFPFEYSEEDKPILAPYLSDERNPDVTTLIDSQYQSGNRVATFELLLDLNQAVFKSIGYLRREQEGVQSPSQTLQSASGSCRDLAALFIAASRQLGLAARFVSGYIFAETSAENPGSTHAWAEVYIPGAGWKGFDSTFGTIVGPDHIPVSVSMHPESVPPVSGQYYGDATSTMHVEVEVTLVE